MAVPCPHEEALETADRVVAVTEGILVRRPLPRLDGRVSEDMPHGDATCRVILERGVTLIPRPRLGVEEGATILHADTLAVTGHALLQTDAVPPVPLLPALRVGALLTALADPDAPPRDRLGGRLDLGPIVHGEDAVLATLATLLLAVLLHAVPADGDVDEHIHGVPSARFEVPEGDRDAPPVSRVTRLVPLPRPAPPRDVGLRA